MSAVTLEKAALAVLLAEDAVRDAMNGYGHPGEEHDHVLGDLDGDRHPVCSTVDDCAACGGAQYGAEDARNIATAALRVALGREPMPFERYLTSDLPVALEDVLVSLGWERIA